MNIETTTRAMVEVWDIWVTPEMQQVLDHYDCEQLSRYPGCSILMLEDTCYPDLLLKFIAEIEEGLEANGLASLFSGVA